MYRTTNKQTSLFSAATLLPKTSARRLKASWAKGFREKIYPLLLESEDEFADLYNGKTGRPNWSVARKLGLCVLQDMLDLDDQSALDAMAFDARWQYALDLAPEDAYLSRRSLITFRGLLVEKDPEMELMRELFDRIGQAAIDELGLSTASQRIDSTFITSNIRTRGRLDLFQKTLNNFMNWLSSWVPAGLSQLSEPLQEWYSESERGYFSKPKKGQLRAKLAEVAGWLVEVMTTFADDEQVLSSEPYHLVVRLVSEHCRVIEVTTESSKVDEDGQGPDGGGGSGGPESNGPEAEGEAEAEATAAQVEVLDAPLNGGSSLQSPFDPDAGYGRKGKGYLVQITETCNNEDQPEIVTDFALQPSNESDHGKTTEALERLESAGKAPSTLYADAGYASGTAFVEAEDRGVQLEAPVPTKAPSDALTREHFDYDDEGNVLECPQGHPPVRHGRRAGRGSGAVPHAYFNADTCRGCALLDLCPVQVPKKGRTAALDISNEARARDEAIIVQRIAGWWDDYAIRTGIEATNSELKRAHGFGKLRVRTRPRVLFAVISKLTACNIKRWLRAARAALAQDGAGPATDSILSWIRALRALLRRCLRIVGHKFSISAPRIRIAPASDRRCAA